VPTIYRYKVFFGVIVEDYIQYKESNEIEDMLCCIISTGFGTITVSPKYIEVILANLSEVHPTCCVVVGTCKKV
jgi:hypothetical protein